MLYEPTPEHNKLEKYSANEIVDVLDTIVNEYKALLYEEDSTGHTLINQIDGNNDFNGQETLSSRLGKKIKLIESIKEYVSMNNISSFSIKEFYAIVAKVLGKKTVWDHIGGVSPEKNAVMEILKFTIGQESVKDRLLQKNPHNLLIFKKLLEYAKS